MYFVFATPTYYGMHHYNNLIIFIFADYFCILILIKIGSASSHLFGPSVYSCHEKFGL